MNRRNWLKALVSVIPLAMVKGTPKTPSSTIDDGKIGYVAVGVYNEQGWPICRGGDIRVYIDGKPADTTNLLIKRANDREGWYEYTSVKRPYGKTYHVQANVRLERVTGL